GDLLVLIAQAEEHAESSSDDPPALPLVREAGSRADVVVVAIHDCARVAVLTGQRPTLLDHVEQGAPVARVHRLREQVVANAQVQRETGADFPIVLYEGTEVDLALAAPVEHLRAFEKGREAEQKIGDGSPGAGRIGARRENRAEGHVSKAAPQVLVARAAKIDAGLESVPAARDA